MKREFENLFRLKDESRLSFTAWYLLDGLRAALRRAVKETGDDPAYDECLLLLRELDSVLSEATDAQSVARARLGGQRSQTEAARTAGGVRREKHEPAVASDAGAASRPRSSIHAAGAEAAKDVSRKTPSQRGSARPPEPPSLTTLCERFAADTQNRRYLGDINLASRSATEAWPELHFYLLRLPPPSAERWRDEFLRFAQESFGAHPSDASNRIIQFYEERVVVPGLAGGMEVRGVTLSPDAPAGDPVARCCGGSHQGEGVCLKTLAQVVSLCSYLLQADRNLQTFMDEFGSNLVDTTVRKEQHRKVLLEKFSDLSALVEDGAGLDKIAHAYLKVSETLLSLVHEPPAHESSWWSTKIYGKVASELNSLVRGHAEGAIDNLFFQYLRPAEYQTIKELTDPGNDVRLYRENETPGKVLACLRPYAIIKGHKFSGRVIYNVGS